jgi:hypothetical protein
MALDFGLLNTNAPAQIAGAYGRGQQEAQANQLAQLQMRQQTASTQGAEMNLTRLKQEHDALDKLMAEITANGGPSDPMQAADMMMKSGIREYFDRGLTMKQSYAQLNNDRVAMGLPPLSSVAAPAPAVSSNRVSEPNAAPGVEVFKVNEQPAPVNALAAQISTEPDKNALMLQAKAKLLSPNVGVREAGKLEMQQLLSPKDTSAPDAKLMQQLGYPLTQAGFKAYQDAKRAERPDLLLNPEVEAQRIRMALASRPPAPPPQPRAEQPLEKVVDPVTGKIVFASREQALQGRMTPATALEGLSPKEIQTREAKYPAATLAVKTIESSSDRLAADLDELAKHPGLSGISGLIYGNTPAITKNARVALEKYKSILARGGFSELQSMRAASPTGGALGNVSNQENQYLRDAFAAIGRSQDTADLKTALESAANVARAAKQRVREAYDMTYDYKTGRSANPAAVPTQNVRSQADAILNGSK